MNQQTDPLISTAPHIGILLTNLGTPDAPTAAAVRRYLAEFLWDPRVVEIPRPLWWLILHGVVLRVRPRRSAHAYQQIWTAQGSPLLSISRAQQQAVARALAGQGLGHIPVALGMRYGRPSISSALQELKQAGVQRLVVLPLYPQYSCATTASTFDAVAAEFSSWRQIPEMRFIADYHDDAGYLQALARSVREHWQSHPPAERLLFSFHGMPERTRRAGDPYYDQCQETARRLAELLALPAGRWQVSFQSRFGAEQWLQPYTDKTLEEWGRKGVSSVEVLCPGFSADCLETLEEIAIQNRDVFIAAGGERYHYLSALNDRPDHILAVRDIVLKHLQGWSVKQ